MVSTSGARARPSELLAGRHDEIVDVVRQERGTGLVEVFGSVARGSDTEASDLDLLVEFGPGADLFNVVALEQRLGDLLGCRVDVVPRSSSGRAARHARRDPLSLSDVEHQAP